MKNVYIFINLVSALKNNKFWIIWKEYCGGWSELMGMFEININGRQIKNLRRFVDDILLISNKINGWKKNVTK